MKELDDVLSASEDGEQRGDACLLATLVKVEGSSYRRAGARLLLNSSGERTGAVSGGCLEAEIARKAWWLTEQGPKLKTYNTASDGDAGMPFGLGCSGVLHVLMQRVGEEENALLAHLRQLRKQRIRSAIATVISGPSIGAQRIFPVIERNNTERPMIKVLAHQRVEEALQRAANTETSEYLQFDESEIFIEALPLAQRLVIFGAGDDAKPLVKFASLLGWHVVVADGRAHMATRPRFPDANEVKSAPPGELPASCSVADQDAVVLMTHSYPQDRALMVQLLDRPLRYLGLLGPRQRTRRILEEINPSRKQAHASLHAPIGLDIGAHTPETIALAIIAEIQSVLSSRLQKSRLEGTEACEFGALPEPASSNSF